MRQSIKRLALASPRALAALFIPAFATSAAHAEPYLAVYKGLPCTACHTHPAGGGMRNAYGNLFAQNELPAKRLGDNDAEYWNGEITKWLSVGANLRGEYRYVDTPNQETISEFDVNRGTVYAEARLVPGRLSLYLDQQVAPGSSFNREAYALLKDGTGRWSLTAGQFFLPYGLRLQDDTAFIRLATGVNFANPDRGVQASYDAGPWSAKLSLTNGSGGGSENDTGKQVSFIGEYVQPNWRAGLSFNHNDSDFGDRQMQGLFAGLRTGPITWLAEADLIQDDLPIDGDRDSIAGLVEGNWLYARGHNLKLTYEYFDPDDDIDEDHQVRWSLVWEYAPMQFLQARLGLRLYDGIPQVDSQNRDEWFVELHGFF